MTSRDRVLATLDHGGPDRLSRDVWGWRFIQRHQPADWARVTEQFPLDFLRVPSVLGPSARAQGERGESDLYTDDWGSAWRSLETGLSGEVTAPALQDWADLEGYEPPYETLEYPALEDVRSACASTTCFRLGEVGAGPFERLQFLRGTEALYVDIGEKSDALDELLARVHDFYLRHFELWCRTDVDAVTLGDDWGSQNALLVAPDWWRRYFKPLYAEYFDLLRQAGKRVFYHSDGMIREIIPDLIEIGVEALNCQVFCMNIEELGRSFRGKVTFWGELDRQKLLPLGSPEEVREAARRLRHALGDGKGGLIAQLHWATDVPTENVLAAFEEFDKA